MKVFLFIKSWFNYITLFVFITIALVCLMVSCSKDIGKNPEIAFSDRALYDSCRNEVAFTYYKNNDQVLQVAAGSNSPHGAFKLKFNKIAAAVLTDNGKLPIGRKFPEGSMIVKEVQSNGLYALMYKHNNSWLWAEINKGGTASFSVTKDASTVCVSCHNQSGQRDLAVSFYYY